MSSVPEGYEPAENSAAKDVVMDALETSLTKQGVDPYDEGSEIELIRLSDDVVEALLCAGVTIPEGLKSPFASGTNYTCPSKCAASNHPGREHEEWVAESR